MDNKLTETLANRLATANLEERLRIVVETLGSGTAFSTSLGKEDQAITHALFTQELPIRVFTLDTGRLFEATQSVLAATRERYGHIETWFPDTAALQSLLTAKGPNSFYDSVEARLQCCHIRKVEPLRRALQGATAWITGLRAGQSANRSQLSMVEWDNDHNLLKIHPLLDWSEEQVDEYVKSHHVPVNRLHAQGYPSIGCAPCTRAVAPGADPRSGRWWWENPNKKECGLHLHQNAQA